MKAISKQKLHLQIAEKKLKEYEALQEEAKRYIECINKGLERSYTGGKIHINIPPINEKPLMNVIADEFKKEGWSLSFKNDRNDDWVTIE